MVKNKVVVITGSATGIGFSTAKLLGQNGAKIVLSDVDISALNLAVNELTEERCDVIGIKCDVSKEDDIKNLIQKSD